MDVWSLECWRLIRRTTQKCVMWRQIWRQIRKLNSENTFSSNSLDKSSLLPNVTSNHFNCCVLRCELFETENISSIFLRIFTWISPLSATKVKMFPFFLRFFLFSSCFICFFIYIFIYFFEQLKNYKNIFIRMCSSIILVLVTRSLHCCSRNSCNLTSISTWALKGVIVFHNRCK